MKEWQMKVIAVWAFGTLLGCGYIWSLHMRLDAKQERYSEAQIDAEHQQAVEDAVVCKLSLALTQERLQRFEQVESSQLQSCCAEE